MVEPTSNDILDALRHVIDPEVGINIVDLGLVHEAEAQNGHVRVVMTMTTPACPLGESISEAVKASVWQNVGGVKSVSIDLVCKPPWQPSMMSPAARERLGWP